MSRDGVEALSSVDGSTAEPGGYVRDEPLSAFALEFRAFADCVLKGVEGPTTGRSERRSLAVVQAGYESAATGRPVNIRHRFGDL